MTTSPLSKAIAKKKTEAQIQQECCQLLDAMGIVYSVTDASRTFGPDGKPRKSKVRRGWPDLVACVRCRITQKHIVGLGYSSYDRHGVFCGIEIKRPGGRQSPEQKTIQRQIEGAHGVYWLVHSAEELRERLK